MSSSKLDPQDVYEIRKYLRMGILTQQQIADKYNVTRSCIGHIKLRKSWKYI